jgi:hypothetical protein
MRRYECPTQSCAELFKGRTGNAHLCCATNLPGRGQEQTNSMASRGTEEALQRSFGTAIPSCSCTLASSHWSSREGSPTKMSCWFMIPTSTAGTTVDPGGMALMPCSTASPTGGVLDVFGATGTALAAATGPDATPGVSDVGLESGAFVHN